MENRKFIWKRPQEFILTIPLSPGSTDFYFRFETGLSASALSVFFPNDIRIRHFDGSFSTFNSSNAPRAPDRAINPCKYALQYLVLGPLIEGWPEPYL